MANHLTPTELAREAGLGRREVLSKCLELGVPIFKGRIDKSLFLANLRNASPVQRRAPLKA
ncbi:MAG TPA: hypothetical protein VLJ42_04565 [Solirubrobacteraceae bacterium]|nr:hypothetical protein [Solirubrobacteraceae bacterium]